MRILLLISVFFFLLTLPEVGGYMFCQNGRLRKYALLGFAISGAGIVSYFLFR